MAGQLLNSLPLHQKSHYCKDWKKKQREREVKTCGFTVQAILSVVVHICCVCVSMLCTLNSAAWADP